MENLRYIVFSTNNIKKKRFVTYKSKQKKTKKVCYLCCLIYLIGCYITYYMLIYIKYIKIQHQYINILTKKWKKGVIPYILPSTSSHPHTFIRTLLIFSLKPNFILDLCTIQTETNSKDKGQKPFSMATPLILTNLIKQLPFLIQT